MLHVSMAVAMMLPPTPRDATRKPITWQMVVDMVCARGAPREPQADGALQPSPQPPAEQLLLSDAFH